MGVVKEFDTDDVVAAGNMVGDTTKAGTQSAQNQTGTKQ
jgi:hypothetical protein